MTWHSILSTALLVVFVIGGGAVILVAYQLVVGAIGALLILAVHIVGQIARAAMYVLRQ